METIGALPIHRQSCRCRQQGGMNGVGVHVGVSSRSSARTLVGIVVRIICRPIVIEGAEHTVVKNGLGRLFSARTSFGQSWSILADRQMMQGGGRRYDRYLPSQAHTPLKQSF